MQNIKEKYLERVQELILKGEVYSQVQRSIIEAWKKIRDAAAHGKHDEYTENQVKDFLSGLRRFIGEYLG